MELRTAEENQLFQKPGSPSKWLISEASKTSVCQTLPIKKHPKNLQTNKQKHPGPQTSNNKTPSWFFFLDKWKEKVWKSSYLDKL